MPSTPSQRTLSALARELSVDPRDTNGNMLGADRGLADWMECFPLLKTVLDEVWAILPGDEQQKQDAVRAQLLDLRRHYARLASSSSISIDYRHPAVRYAYLAAYVTSHSNMVSQLIAGTADLRSLFQQDAVHVSCIGGGPGSDLLGVLKYVADNNLKPRLKFFLYDREQAWSDSWSDVDDKLSTVSPITISTYFEQFDVTDPESWTLKSKYLHADLFTMIYFVSEVYRLREQARAFFVNLFGAAKTGALFLFVDNASSQFFEWFDELRDEDAFDVVDQSDSVTIQLPYDEEKTDLGPHFTRLGDSPKLKGNVSYRVLRKR